MKSFIIYSSSSELAISSSLGMIFSLGSFSVFLLAILRSSERSSDGSNNKLASIAKSKVVDTKPPKALVPPKLEIKNTEKPKNRTVEV